MANEKEIERCATIYNQTLLDLKEVEGDSRTSLSNTNNSLACIQICETELKQQLDKTSNVWAAYEPYAALEKVKFESEACEYRVCRRSAVALLKEIADALKAIQPSNPRTAPPRQNVLPVPKFAPITIPTFSGKAEEFTSFWEIFTSLVHDRTDLDPVIKFATLKSHLKDRALRTIEGLSVTGDNYAIAVATLQDQFGNKDKLVSSLIREFQNLSIPNHNHSELLNFKLSYEKLVSQIQNLNSLDTNSRFFVEILASKIPAETFKTLVNKYDTTTFTFAQISEGLAEFIKVMELCSLQPHSKEVKNVASTNLSIEANQKSSKSKIETSSSKSTNSTSNASGNNKGSKPLQCVFCEASHSSKFCTVYGTLDQRHQRVKAKKLYFCCLNTGHFSKNCKQTPFCRHCNAKSHHTFLCAKLCQPP